MTSPNRRAEGFTLAELLMVVAIIMILVAVTVPNYIRTREAPNAASAVQSLRIYSQYEMDYRNSYGVYADLQTLASRGYITDPSLKQGTKSNYTFTLTPNPADPTINYTATATPGRSEWKHFFMDASRVITYEQGTPANASSPPLQ